MTNEELLEKLREISSLMVIDKDNSAELGNLIAQKEVLEKEISDLELKLSDDANYSDIDYEKSVEKIDFIKATIEKLKVEQQRAETSILSDTTRAQQVDIDIELCNELISETEQRIDEIGREIKALDENPNKKLERELSKELKSRKERLDSLREELSVYTTEREALVNGINFMTGKSNEYTTLIEKYQKLEKTMSVKEKSVDNLDKVSDQQRLNVLVSELQLLESRISYLNSPIQKELELLISEIESGSIDENSIIPRVKSIREHISQLSIESGNAIPFELENKHAELSNEISLLESKLSDVVNYTPSMMAIALNDEISVIQSRIAEYDASISASEQDIKESELEISSNNAQMDRYFVEIEELELMNSEIRFRMSNPKLSKNDRTELDKQIKSNNKLIKNYKDQIERLIKNNSTLETAISNSKKNKREKEYLRISDEKLSQSKKESLEDKKTIDRFSILKDQERLAVLLAELVAVETQETIFGLTCEGIFMDIISNYDPKLAAKVSEELVVTEPEDVQISENVLEPESVETGEVVSEPESVQTAEIVPEFEEVETAEVVSEPEQVQTEEVVPEVEQVQVENVNVQSNLSNKTNAPIAIISFRDPSVDLVDKAKSLAFLKALRDRLFTQGLILEVGEATPLLNESVLESNFSESFNVDADTEMSDFTGVNVGEANLDGLVSEPDFTGVNLDGINLDGLDSQPDFTGVNLDGIDLDESEEIQTAEVVTEPVSTEVVEEQAYEMPSNFVIEQTEVGALEEPVVESVDLQVPGNVVMDEVGQVQSDSTVVEEPSFDLDYEEPTALELNGDFIAVSQEPVVYTETTELPSEPVIEEQIPEYTAEPEFKSEDDVVSTVVEPEVNNSAYSSEISPEDQAMLAAYMEQAELENSISEGGKSMGANF